MMIDIYTYIWASVDLSTAPTKVEQFKNVRLYVATIFEMVTILAESSKKNSTVISVHGMDPDLTSLEKGQRC